MSKCVDFSVNFNYDEIGTYIRIKLIRENDNPEQALMTATVIILNYLTQHESFEVQVPAYLQVQV